MNKIQRIAVIGGIIGIVASYTFGSNSDSETDASHRSRRPSQIMIPTDADRPTASRLTTLAPNSPTSTQQHYVPQVYDVTPTLVAESRCCFFTSRWFLQPVNIISPIIASALVGFGEYYIDSNPSVARILNGVGLGFSVLDFISGVLLAKIDNKLQGIDEVVQARRELKEGD